MKRIEYKKLKSVDFSDKFYQIFIEGLNLVSKSKNSIVKIENNGEFLDVNLEKIQYSNNKFQIIFILDNDIDKNTNLIDRLKRKRKTFNQKSVNLEYIKFKKRVNIQTIGYWTSLNVEHSMFLNLSHSIDYELKPTIKKFYDVLSLSSRKKLWKRIFNYEKKKTLESFIWFWNYLIYSFGLKFNISIWGYDSKEKKSKFLIKEETPLYITTKEREHIINCDLEKRRMINKLKKEAR